MKRLFILAFALILTASMAGFAQSTTSSDTGKTASSDTSKPAKTKKEKPAKKSTKKADKKADSDMSK